MQGNARISRKQQQFLQGLLLGQSIVAVSAAIGINEATAYRWLKLPHVQAERQRLEDELRQAEEAEITRIMTHGYAAVHERVKALDYQAREMEKPYIPDPDSGKEYYLRNSPEHMREWRGLLDDIAKETGGRVKRQEVTGKDGGPIDVRNPDLKQLTDEELDLLQMLAEQAQERRGRGSTT